MSLNKGLLMNHNDFIDTLSNNIRKILPPGLDQLKSDWDKNLHSIIQNAFGKLDLVTREEFDIQTKVLARTRQKLEALEIKIQE